MIDDDVFVNEDNVGNVTKIRKSGKPLLRVSCRYRVGTVREYFDLVDAMLRFFAPGQLKL